jgi:hypothetical protein
MTIFPMISQQLAVVLTAKLASLSILVSSAEYLASPYILGDSGLMSWAVGRLRSPVLVRGYVGRTLDGVLAYPRILGIIGLRALIAFLILFGPSTLVLNRFLLSLLVTLSTLLAVRNVFGRNGADQMEDILFMGLAIVSIVPTHVTMNIYLAFLAFQACLAYATAGVAKAVASGWRDGTFLIGICGTGIYGNARLRDILLARPTLAKWLARSVIIWECTFPLVLLLPLPLAIVVLVGGIVFHLVNGYIMGLNDFVWAFLAAYPAILYYLQIRGW